MLIVSCWFMDYFISMGSKFRALWSLLASVLPPSHLLVMQKVHHKLPNFVTPPNVWPGTVAGGIMFLVEICLRWMAYARCMRALQDGWFLFAPGPPGRRKLRGVPAQNAEFQEISWNYFVGISIVLAKACHRMELNPDADLKILRDKPLMENPGQQ